MAPADELTPKDIERIADACFPILVNENFDVFDYREVANIMLDELTNNNEYNEHVNDVSQDEMNQEDKEALIELAK